MVLNVFNLGSEGKTRHTRDSEFVVRVNPGNLGRYIDIVIGNNGSYLCDATALRLRVYATDTRVETAGKDVTQKVQAAFQGKLRTDLGKYADLFGDPAPGQEKTLKLSVQDLCGNSKTIEIPEDAPIELP